ncbi:hypothetical protein ACXR6G_17865 [Ancylomarina sp. YFZ004]
MTKKTILLTILIFSILLGAFSVTKFLMSKNEFQERFVEFSTPSEQQIVLEEGIYDLFELSTKSDIENDIDYIISIQETNPMLIEISEDTNDSVENLKTTIRFTINDNVYKSIGYFEIDNKQSVTLISNVTSSQIDKLAYKIKTNTNTFFDVMKFGLLFLISVVGILISGISLIVIINKKKTIANDATIL